MKSLLPRPEDHLAVRSIDFGVGVVAVREKVVWVFKLTAHGITIFQENGNEIWQTWSNISVNYIWNRLVFPSNRRQHRRLEILLI